MSRTEILLTEGSSTSARQTLYALGRRHTIDILDSSPLCQCRFSRFVRRWHRCPPFSRRPVEYLAFLVDLLQHHRYDVLLPIHEQLYLLSRYREQLSRYVGLAVPDFEAIDRVIGKANFSRLLDELGLPQPETAIVRDRRQLLSRWKLPCYVKLDQSTAGQGVRYVETREQLGRVADEFERAGWLDGRTEVLVQQPAQGVKSSVSGIFQQGRLVAAYCDRAGQLGIGGGPMDRLCVYNAQAIDDMQRLGRRLDWHGAITIEYYDDARTGQLQYTECNPRVGETVNVTLSGLNVCEQLVKVSLGEQVEPLPAPRVPTRTYKGFLVLMAKAMNGASRRQLAAELWRRCTGRGFYAGGQDELTRPQEDWMSLIPDVAVSLQTILWPRSAERLVRRTVENYSLSQSAAQTIAQLPAELDETLRLAQNGLR